MHGLHMHKQFSRLLHKALLVKLYLASGNHSRDTTVYQGCIIGAVLLIQWVYLEVRIPKARHQLSMDSQDYEGALSESRRVQHYAQQLQQLPHP